MEPGTTITPNGDQPAPQTPDSRATHVPQPKVPPAADQPDPAPTPVPTPPPSTEPAPTPPEPPVASPTAPASNWQFAPEDQSSTGSDEPYTRPNIEPISWTASEYIDHEKNRSWFFAIGGATLLIAIIAYALTRDVLSAIIIMTAGILLAISAARKPRTLSFQLNDHGLQVGSKFYAFGDFKSFTVLEEGALSSIQLLPAKRFMPSLSIYYPPEQEEAIISSLGNILPHEDRPRDAVDSLMRRIKF